MPKANIENITVEISSYRPVIQWQRGSSRYHVWLDYKTSEPEETIYQNPLTAKMKGEPGYFGTRKLDRSSQSKADASMFAEVWAIVQRDDLIGKADRARATALAKQKHHQALDTERRELEQQALNCWKNGAFDKMAELHGRYRKIADDLLVLEVEE